MKTSRRQRLHTLDRILLATFAFALFGCASPSARERLDERQSQNNARAAAYAADGFTIDYRSPEPRPYRAWEFYYKTCSLVSRNPYPSRSDYSCSDPY